MLKSNPLFLSIQAFLLESGRIGRFTGRFFRESLRMPFEFREFLRQCFLQGYRSLPLVSITAFIMGFVLTIQSRPTLVEFGAEAWLPAMVAVSIVREIGPVVIALICAGRISSGIGAELGSMKVTEQIDAMEVSGAHPFRFVVLTRIWATTLMLPLLVTIANGISFYGSFIAINIKDNVSATLYFRKVFDTLDYSDVIPAFIKTFLFGFAIGLVGCYKGYNSQKGTEGVGLAANSAVVMSSLLIFIIDLVTVQVTDLMQIL